MNRNIKRRTQRLETFFHNSSFPRAAVHAVEAFDGTMLEFSDGLKMLFRNTSYSDRRAIIAASLTHFMLWRHIGKSENQFHLIMEDDALFSPSFIENWNSQYFWSFPLDTGIMFLGGVKRAMLKKHAEVLKPVSLSFASHSPNSLFSNMLDEDIDGEVNQVQHS